MPTGYSSKVFKSYKEARDWVDRYPKVEHKIPELFQIIIKVDKLLELFHARKVVPFKRFHAAKKRRVELSQAAEKFIQRQKGGNV